MLVKLKNVGDAPRVLYNKLGKVTAIPIGEEKSVDLAENIVTRLRAAQDKGDTLLVASATERVRVRTPSAVRRTEAKAPEVRKLQAPAPVVKVDPETNVEPKDPPNPVAKHPAVPPAGKVEPKPAPKMIDATLVTALEALKTAEDLDYHSLLAVVQRVVPDHKLPPRPTKNQMLDVLRAAAKKEG